MKVPFLYDVVKDGLIRDNQDEVLEKYLIPVDPAPWEAEEVYQVSWSGGVLDEPRNRFKLRRSG